MYAVIESSTSPRSCVRGPVELSRHLTRRAAEAAICALLLAGRWDSHVERLLSPPVWVEHVPGVVETAGDVGRFRVARDGRSFIQVGRLCVWGRRGESEDSLRARKGVD